MLNTAYLSLGSNIDPEENLKSAVEMLAGRTNLLKVSTVWETKPLGTTDQANFLNAALIVETGLSAPRLKAQVLSEIERSLGRVRQIDKNAPRTIDIDIVLFNNEIFDLGNRHIPDPEILDRPFVALTLAEIAPDYIHPETGQTLREIGVSFKVSAGEMCPRPEVSEVLADLVARRVSGSSVLKRGVFTRPERSYF